MMREKQIKILSTKKIPETLMQQAKANNILIDEINFIETKPVKTPAVIDKIKHFAEQKITAVFTSANAVEAVFSQIDTKPDWKVLCISGKTKNALLKSLNEDAIINAAMNASSLADKITEEKKINSCVFFCGNQRLNTLPDKLLKRKINLEELIVYETILSPKKISETYNGIMFFSPSAVESFFSVNKIGSKTILFSIGKTTTGAIKKLSNNVVVTAENPSAESVIKEVRDFYLKTDK